MRKSIFKPCTRIALFGWIVAGALLATMPIYAQDSQQPNLPTIPAALEKQLAARAVAVKEVTLDKNMLNLGSQFMDSKQATDRQAKQLVQKLNAIYIRKYEFDKPGAYTEEDLKIIRQQFQGTEWTPVVRKSEKGEGEKDIYFRVVNGEIHGIAILRAEPKELALIDISGFIDPKDVGELSGNFGIPNIDASANSTKSKVGTK